MNMGLAGYYTIHKQKVLTDESGQIVLNEHGEQILIGQAEKITEFQNLITDVGLNAIARGDGVLSYCLLSADNAIPKRGDTNISVLGYASYPSSLWGKNVESEPYYLSSIRKFRFNAGVATGNISKVAISSENTGNNIFSVSLIKDTGDQTTTITKLADEILDITYELRLYVNTQDYTGKVNVSGQEHNVIVRPAMIQDWHLQGPEIYSLFVSSTYVFGSDISDIKSRPSGNSLIISNAVKQNYVEQSLTKSFIASANTEQGNIDGGIRSLVFSHGFYEPISFQIQFDPPIMKNNKQTLIFPAFNLIYGRYGDDS